ncbi:MAG TPA: CocE/NonD family hydrolase [Caulobacteraceae bacterium]|nr:CocE/NonD family hydrolase [Caulobacteraceae bacterium]
MRQGSVGFDPAAIRCAVYFVGGWADPYNETIPRLISALDVPSKAVIGPWGHGYPQPASPGPALEWIEEEARWWRHWLAGEATTVMDAPRARLFLCEAAPATAPGEDLRGGWIGAPGWPTASHDLRFSLRPGRLTPWGHGAGEVTLQSDPAIGLAMPEWCPFSPTQLPQEQSEDDARAARFDSAPLASPIELVGTPRLRIRLRSSAPIAQLAARLCEVDAEGLSWLIAWGLLNLTHRDGHESPAPLPVGEPVEVELPLSLTARRVAAGARLRLSLSEGLWPLVWPSPEPVELALELASAELSLSLRGEEWTGCEPPALPAPGVAGDRASWPQLSSSLDDEGVASFLEVSPPSRSVAPDTGVSVERGGAEVVGRASQATPGENLWKVRQDVRYRRDDFDAGLEVEVELTSTPTHFRIRERLTARLFGAEIFTREEVAEIARDLM